MNAKGRVSVGRNGSVGWSPWVEGNTEALLPTVLELSKHYTQKQREEAGGGGGLIWGEKISEGLEGPN